MGLTGEALDTRIGWADRYSAKAENPGAQWGKRLFRMHAMGEIWLMGVNRALVLMDRDQAESLVRAHDGSDSRGVERVRVLRHIYR